MGADDRELAAMILGFLRNELALDVAEIGEQSALVTTGILDSAGLVRLAALLVWNKRGARGGGVLPSQGVVLLGVSYLVLKATAALVDGAGGADRRPDLGEIVAWLAFLPTYPAGPIERLEHFAPQRPGF